jgi:hypothetical protein
MDELKEKFLVTAYFEDECLFQEYDDYINANNFFEIMVKLNNGPVQLIKFKGIRGKIIKVSQF